MYVLILSVLIIELLFSFRHPLYGLCFLVAVKILIPDNVRLLFADVSLNTACSLILVIGYLLNLMIRKVDFKGLDNGLFRYILFFMAFSVLIMLLTSYVPIDAQIKPFSQFMLLQLFPVIISMSVIRNKNDLKSIINVFLISALICILYSLICFVFAIPYPYNNWCNGYFEARDENINAVLEQNMGNISGRCMGTATSGTYDYGMVISIIFTTVGCIYYRFRKLWILIIFILCGLDVLCTTRRAPIITSMIFIIILVLGNSHNRKRTLLYGCIGLLSVILCIYIFPQLKDFRSILETSLFFWDDSVASRNNVSGSSVAYRLYQLKYTLIYIGENPLFGNGWGAMYYKIVNATMNGWESIVFTTLMQFGFVGGIVWSLLFYKFYRYTIVNKQRLLGLAFILSALALCILTDTIYHFYIFFGAVLIHKMEVLNNIESNFQINKIHSIKNENRIYNR